MRMASAVESSGRDGGWFPCVIRVVNGRTYDVTPYWLRISSRRCDSRADAMLQASVCMADGAHTAAVIRRLDGF